MGGSKTKEKTKTSENSTKTKIKYKQNYFKLNGIIHQKIWHYSINYSFFKKINKLYTHFHLKKCLN